MWPIEMVMSARAGAGSAFGADGVGRCGCRAAGSTGAAGTARLAVGAGASTGAAAGGSKAASGLGATGVIGASDVIGTADGLDRAFAVRTGAGRETEPASRPRP
jgi:hypothetical protein